MCVTHRNPIVKYYTVVTLCVYSTGSNTVCVTAPKLNSKILHGSNTAPKLNSKIIVTILHGSNTPKPNSKILHGSNTVCVTQKPNSKILHGSTQQHCTTRVVYYTVCNTPKPNSKILHGSNIAVLTTRYYWVSVL